MDKNLLDSMSGQELKEMIDGEIITLENLDNAALEKIMNFEIDMLCFGTGDMTTIRRCSELLNERNDSKTNKDSIISIINKAKQERVIIVDEERPREPEAKVIRRKNIILRRIGLVAAILTLMIATTTFGAAAFGVDIFEYIKNIVGEQDGTAIHIDEFTFYNTDTSKKYSSIEEMVDSENLNIMYPTVLPEGVEIDSVRLTRLANGNDSIRIFTNIATVNIQIELNVETIESNCDNIYQYNGLMYYVEHYFEYEDFYAATCYYKNNRYSISANTYENLILIINNMKE